MLELLREVVRNGAQLELHDALLLTQSARAGYSAVVGELLGRHSVRSSSFALSRALTAAAENGHRQVVRQLLAMGAPPYAYQSAALAAAASYGDADVVYDLCMAGADATSENSKALRRAVQLGHVSAATVLLRYGADPRVLCSAALAHACAFTPVGPDSTPPGRPGEVSTPPLAGHANARFKTHSTNAAHKSQRHHGDGGEPKRCASCVGPSGSGSSGIAPTSGLVSVIQHTKSSILCSCCTGTGSGSPASSFLCASVCASANSPRAGGALAVEPSGISDVGSNDALGCCGRSCQGGCGCDCSCGCSGCCEAGVLRLVELLLRAGADARAHGHAALEAAAGRGRSGVVRMLLAAGADPAASNSSALVAATVQGYVDIVAQLLEAGADPWDASDLALRTALERGHRPVVAMIREAQKAAYDALETMLGSTAASLANVGLPWASHLPAAPAAAAAASASGLSSRGFTGCLNNPAFWRMLQSQGNSNDGLGSHSLGLSTEGLFTSPPQLGAVAGGRGMVASLADSFKGLAHAAAAGTAFAAAATSRAGGDPSLGSSPGSHGPQVRVGSTAGRVGRPLGGPLLNLSDPKVAAAFLSQL